MKKVKVLAVAPYEGLRNQMKNVALGRKDIELHPYIGDLQKGKDLVLTLPNLDSFDVIISRGGTAEMIQEVVPIPVIDIKLTEYDIMRSIKLAQNHTGRLAIVGFPNIIQRAKIISDLMQNKVDTYIIRSGEEAEKIIGKLQSLEYSLIVGDVITVAKAKMKGINGILITSGDESINAAFSEALKVVKAIELSAQRSSLYLTMLNNANINIIAYNKDKSIVFSNFSYNHEELSILKEKLSNYIHKTLETRHLKLIIKSDGYLWNVKGFAENNHDTEYIIFYINKLFSVSAKDTPSYTIRNITDKEDHSIINFYLSSNDTKDIIKDVKKFSLVRQPILIYGENGSRKDSIAYHIHTNSPLKKQPFLEIDCKHVKNKLNNLLYSEDSPLAENDISIYLKNIHCLNADSQLKIVNYLEDSFLHKRNQVIYSTEKPINITNMDTLVEYLIGNSVQRAISITIPPLRFLKNEIPSLASICISELNLELGKQVVGTTDEAMELLKNFSWEMNIYQFYNVLKKLILVTDNMMIQKEETYRVLEEEKSFLTENQTPSFNINGTLDVITSNIIRMVLEEEDMNQSKAAKRLGISRSTLWRKLKAEMQ